MIPVIEQIVRADEISREKVTAARLEADHIRLRAEQTAQETAVSRMRELADAARIEQESVLANARSHASRIAAETDHYIEELQQKKQAIHEDLIENLLKKVVGA